MSDDKKIDETIDELLCFNERPSIIRMQAALCLLALGGFSTAFFTLWGR